ncbi:MAG: Holliday junction resolvase RuvX [Muribaculaceae bacterium]|nr:Holliday junction resolvase RuvX [Muribaculaceae bacterium]
MARILGIDYGRRRTGVAVTDTLQIVAGAIGTIPSHTVLQFVKDYIAREDVERIVVGHPLQLNGEPSESMRYITPFVNSLRKQLPDVPVTLYDERFTSAIAHQAMIDGGMKKSDRREKGRVDSIAATIILNDYLTSRSSQDGEPATK